MIYHHFTSYNIIDTRVTYFECSRIIVNKMHVLPKCRLTFRYRNTMENNWQMICRGRKTNTEIVKTLKWIRAKNAYYQLVA